MSTDTAADNFIKSLASDAYESSSQSNNNNNVEPQEERSLSYREKVKIENDQILRDLEEKDREA